MVVPDSIRVVPALPLSTAKLPYSTGMRSGRRTIGSSNRRAATSRDGPRTLASSRGAPKQCSPNASPPKSSRPNTARQAAGTGSPRLGWLKEEAPDKPAKSIATKHETPGGRKDDVRATQTVLANRKPEPSGSSIQTKSSPPPQAILRKHEVQKQEMLSTPSPTRERKGVGSSVDFSARAFSTPGASNLRNALREIYTTFGRASNVFGKQAVTGQDLEECLQEIGIPIPGDKSSRLIGLIQPPKNSIASDDSRPSTASTHCTQNGTRIERPSFSSFVNTLTEIAGTDIINHAARAMSSRPSSSVVMSLNNRPNSGSQTARPSTSSDGTDKLFEAGCQPQSAKTTDDAMQANRQLRTSAGDRPRTNQSTSRAAFIRFKSYNPVLSNTAELKIKSDNFGTWMSELPEIQSPTGANTAATIASLAGGGDKTIETFKSTNIMGKSGGPSADPASLNVEYKQMTSRESRYEAALDRRVANASRVVRNARQMDTVREQRRLAALRNKAEAQEKEQERARKNQEQKLMVERSNAMRKQNRINQMESKNHDVTKSMEFLADARAAARRRQQERYQNALKDQSKDGTRQAELEAMARFHQKRNISYAV